MKKLLLILLFINSIASAQNKQFVASNYVVQFDTTTKIFETYQITPSTFNYAVFTSNYAAKLFDCYEGKVFIFNDTLVTGDLAQIGTTGVYRLTVHNNLVNTTKRNIFLPQNNLLLSFNTTTQSIQFGYNDDGNWPIIIKNTSTGARSVSIFRNGEMLFDVPVTSVSTFSVMKKVIIN